MSIIIFTSAPNFQAQYQLCSCPLHCLCFVCCFSLKLKIKLLYALLPLICMFKSRTITDAARVMVIFSTNSAVEATIPWPIVALDCHLHPLMRLNLALPVMLMRLSVVMTMLVTIHHSWVAHRHHLESYSHPLEFGSVLFDNEMGEIKIIKCVS